MVQEIQSLSPITQAPEKNSPSGSQLARPAPWLKKRLGQQIYRRFSLHLSGSREELSLSQSPHTPHTPHKHTPQQHERGPHVSRLGGSVFAPTPPPFSDVVCTVKSQTIRQDGDMMCRKARGWKRDEDTLEFVFKPGAHERDNK